MTREGRHQLALGLVQRPARGEEAAVLVAVRVAQHHLLGLVAGGQQVPVDGQREQALHDPGGVLQVADGLEQRHDVDVERVLQRAQQARFLQQHRQLEQVGDVVGLGNDAVANRRLAIALVRAACRAKDRQLAFGLVRVAHVGRGERARGGELLEQQRAAARFVPGAVVGARAGDLEQLGHHALMHVGVLAQVNRRQMKAEHLHRAAQLAQPPAAERGRTVGHQRAVQGVEILGQRGRIGIGFGAGDRVARGLVAEQCAVGGGQPGVEAGHRAAVGLVAAVRGVVARALGQRQQRVRGTDEALAHRQLRAQRVQLVEVVLERHGSVHRQRLVEYLGGDEGVAVAVAADPAADLQEIGQLGAGQTRRGSGEAVL